LPPLQAAVIGCILLAAPVRAAPACAGGDTVLQIYRTERTFLPGIEICTPDREFCLGLARAFCLARRTAPGSDPEIFCIDTSGGEDAPRVTRLSPREIRTTRE